MNSPQISTAKRNLRALFVVAFFLTLLAGGCGAFILIFAYPHPNVTEPLWQFGQWMMFFSLINFFVYLGIFFQVRRLAKNSYLKPPL